MASEFVARNGVIAQNNSIVTGSLTVTNGIVGSLTGTSSYASNADTIDGLDSSVFATTSSLNANNTSFVAFSASINSFSSSILSYTSSNDAKIASIYSTTSSLNASVASILSFTASTILTDATQSVRLSALEAATASLYTTTASFGTRVGALEAQTASLLSFTASTALIDATQSVRLSALEAATASLYTATSSFSVRVGSLEAQSASLLSYTSSNDAKISSLYGATSSLFNFSSSVNNATSSLYSFTSSLNARSSSFATTGSNTFVGNQTITGSINISGSINSSGTITAQTLVVQVITSSQDYVTGSTRFGSVTTNTHQFTGSVSASGSLNVNSGVLYADGSNVGIGTTSPDIFSRAYNGRILGISSLGQSAIELNGAAGSAAYIDMGVNGTRYLGLYSDASSSDISTIGAYPLTFGTNSTTRMTITSGGSVGIGTTAPNDKLDVSGSDDGGLTIRANSRPTITLVDTGNSTSKIWIAQDDIRFSTYNVASAVSIVGSSGNVGINTTSPSAPLQVVNSSYGNSAIFNTSGAYPIVMHSTSSAGTYYGTSIMMSADSGSTQSGMRIWTRYNAASGVGVAMTFEAATNSQSYGANPTTLTYSEKMRITQDGNVGIGTTSPSHKLTVLGTGGAAGSGILLSTNDQGLFVRQNDGTTIQRLTYLGSDNVSRFLLGPSGFRFRKSDDATEVVTIDTNGNVGIGTTNPGYKLEVNGTGYFASDLNVNANINLTANNSYLCINRSSTASDGLVIYKTGGSNRWLLGAWGNTNNTFYLYSYGVGNSVFNVDYSTGAATFSSSAEAVITWARTSCKNWALASDSAGGYFKNTTDSVIPIYMTNAGNVGIGTTSPNVPLEVNGAIRTTRSGVASQYLQLEGGDATGPFITAVGAAKVLTIRNNSTTSSDINFDQAVATGYYFKQASTTKMILDASGNLGIGTTAPNEKLQVAGNIHAYAPSGIDAGLYASTAGGSTTVVIRSNSTSYFNGGNVGIGTTSPSYKLHVVGSIYTSTNLTSAGSITIGMSPAPFWNAKFTDYSDGSGVYIGSVQAGGYKYISGESYYNNSSYWYSDTTTSTAIGLGSGILRFYTNSGLTANTNFTPSERMRITSGGNVLINTTSVSDAKLDVYNDSSNFAAYFRSNTIYAGSYRLMRWYANGNNIMDISSTNGTDLYMNNNQNGFINFGTNASDRLRITSDGNVGIGTTSPGYTLEIAGTTYIKSGLNVGESSTGAGSLLKFVGGSSYYNFLIAKQYNIDAGLEITPSTATGGSTFSTPAVVIKYNGNVGIGTTNPTYKLTVIGSALFSSDTVTQGNYYLDSSHVIHFDSGVTNNYYIGKSSSNLYFYTGGSFAFANGNVGIGSTSPRYKLDVAGTTFGSLSDQGTYTLNKALNFNGADYQHKYILLAKVPTFGAATINATIQGRITTARVNELGISNNTDFALYIGYANGVYFNKTEYTNNNPFTLVQFTYSGTNYLALYAYTAPNWSYGSFVGTITNVGGHLDSNLLAVVETGSAQHSSYSSYTTYPTSFQGSVGIGTTSPGYSLQVGNTGAGYNMAIIGSTTAGIEVRTSTAGGRIAALEQYYANEGSLWLYDSNTTKILFRASGSSYINPTVGNVGIGTTSPGYKLDVNGNGRFSSGIGSDSLNAITYPYTLTLGTSGADAGSVIATAGSTSGYISSIYIGAGSASPANTIILTTASTERMRITSGGSLLTNNTTENVYDTNVSSNVKDYWNNQFSTINGGTYSKVLLGATTTSGILGFATLNASSKYIITAGIYGIMTSTTAGSETGDLAFYTKPSGGGMSSYERMRILSGGNVGIGTTAPAYALDVYGTIRASGDVIAYSDARVKENVNTITDALTKVISLRGVSYTRKDTEDKSEKVGVIAQEVLEILPQVVQQDTEGNYSVAYGNIVGVLIEAIKELKAEIDILKQK